jgi:hypothetical protein
MCNKDGFGGPFLIQSINATESKSVLSPKLLVEMMEAGYPIRQARGPSSSDLYFR